MDPYADEDDDKKTLTDEGYNDIRELKYQDGLSTKRCPLCWNVVSKNCNMVRDATGTTIPVYTANTRRFKMTSNRFCPFDAEPA